MNPKHNPWSRSALTALEFLYQRGWPLEAIALHCGGVDGCARTCGGVWSKANAIGLQHGRKGGRYRARGDQYDDDLREMMEFDLTQAQMAAELSEKHRLPFSQAWVWRRIERMPKCGVVQGYKRRKAFRRSRAMVNRNASDRARRTA